MENYYNSSYPESGHSSPRSREIEFDNPPPWEDSQTNQLPPNYKVKFMCSYGGKIHPRPHDNQLSYIGGETKILAVDRNIKFGTMLSKLISLCDSDAISFKYQLPGEDLDALISVTNDDDLEHMMHEYDRLYRNSPKPARLRIFIFPNLNPSLNSSVRSFGSDEGKTEKEKFVEALNSAPLQPALPAAAVQQLQPPLTNVDFLFGLEQANVMAAAPPPVVRTPEFEDPVILQDKLIASDPIQQHIHDLQRLRIEDQQQGMYRRKSDDAIPGGIGGGEYQRMQEKVPQVPHPGGVPYWTENQLTSGAFQQSSINHDQQVYIIPAPSGGYHAPMMRPVAGAPAQGYYTVYRDQQQMYNMIPQGAMSSMSAAANPNLQQQKMAGYPEGYTQVAYDGGAGRQVMYSTPGSVIGAPAPGQAQYQAMAPGDGRQAGVVNAEAGVKVVTAKPTQSPV